MFLQKLQQYKDDTQGNFAVIFAIIVVVILLAVSVAINTLEMHSKKLKLNNAADIAVIAAVNEAKLGAVDNDDSQWDEVITLGNTIFEENIANLEGIGEVTYDLKVNARNDNREIWGELTYSTIKPTFLPGILGRDDVVISETVKASKTVFKFARINFLIDVSTSMGVGSDTDNQELMRLTTGCAIACHTNGSLTAARNANIRLRIDTVKDAVAHMVTQLKDIRGENNEFQVGLYTFSNSVIQHLAPTTNLDTVLSSIDSIDVTTENLQWGTNIQFSLEQLNGIIPVSQNGRDGNQRQSFVVVLTDGVENSRQLELLASGNANVLDPNYVPFPPVHGGGVERIQGFNPLNCQVLKDSGHTLAFLNPIYLIPENATDEGAAGKAKFEFIQNTLIQDITQHSQECSSSPAFTYSAETEEQVEQATFDLFNDLLGRDVRLTE